MTLNDRITKILEESGLTSSDFADEIDVQRSSISHITSGRNKPSLEFITKIKSRFPKLSWDWLINGEGEMNAIDQEEIDKIKAEEDAKNKSVALPDLFSLIDDDQFGITESEDKIAEAKSGESFNPVISEKQNQIVESQPLENNNQSNIKEDINNQEVTLKRIVMFYSNGKFESFDQ